jgi:hypothetical protein
MFSPHVENVHIGTSNSQRCSFMVSYVGILHPHVVTFISRDHVFTCVGSCYQMLLLHVVTDVITCEIHVIFL